MLRSSLSLSFSPDVLMSRFHVSVSALRAAYFSFMIGLVFAIMSATGVIIWLLDHPTLTQKDHVKAVTWATLGLMLAVGAIAYGMFRLRPEPWMALSVQRKSRL